MIDVNVSLFQWPFRRLTYDDPVKFAAKLQSRGVTQAWAGSFEGVLHRDIEGVNRRLAEACRTYGDGLFVPFGSVNPQLPDWREDVRRCHEDYQMPGIRLHPNYHGYDLKAPEFAKLLSLAEERKLIVQLALRMEDDRTHHPLVQVSDVDATPLLDLLPQHPALRVVLVNSLRTLAGGLLTNLTAHKNVYVEISMKEGVAGITNLLTQVPHPQILFGSHAPFFIFESAENKLRESELGETIRRAIARGNAEGVLSESS
jgi:uncharacterized protein